jgi:hypothetical protein
MLERWRLQREEEKNGREHMMVEGGNDVGARSRDEIGVESHSSNQDDKKI